MEIPDQIRIRLLLTFDNIIFNKFYWFEMKNYDLYWGSAYKSAKIDKSNAVEVNNSTQSTITVSENFDEIIKVSGKYSYHESGSVH